MRIQRIASRALARVVRVLLAVAAVTVLGATAAHAYWATTGSGAGSASSGTMTITGDVLTGVTTDTMLSPGSTADAILKVHNANAYPVQVVAITATGTPQAGNGCSPTGVTFTSPTNFADPRFSLPAGQSTVLHLAGAMSMDTTSADTCQGQTFSFPVTVTVQK